MRIIFLFIILTLSIFFSSLVFLFIFKPSKPYVIISNKYFDAEIAKTDSQKEIGLSKYSDIRNNFAMVFIFEKPDYYSFWMKEMKFSIDIIYVRDGKIIGIFKNVPYPKSNTQKLSQYRPNQIADTVIEIKASLSDKYNFKKGDKVLIKI